jgi:hypothetical protein
LKSAFSDMSIASPTCFQIPFSWNIAFHSKVLKEEKNKETNQVQIEIHQREKYFEESQQKM